MPNRIQIKGASRLEEIEASGIFSPGHLVELDSAGKVLKHSTVAGVAEAAFAEEDALQGKTIADAYAIGDKAQIRFQQKGSVVYAWLKDGQVVVIGDKLVSNGDGTLKKVAVAADYEIAIAVEALSPSGADGRIEIRVI